MLAGDVMLLLIQGLNLVRNVDACLFVLEIRLSTSVCNCNDVSRSWSSTTVSSSYFEGVITRLGRVLFIESMLYALVSVLRCETPCCGGESSPLLLK